MQQVVEHNTKHQTNTKNGCRRALLLHLLLAATTLLWGHCGRHNSPPASSVTDFVFCRSHGSHVTVDTVHPSLLRSSSFFFSQVVPSLSSDEVMVLLLYVAKPPQSCFPAPVCDIIYIQSLPDVIISYIVYGHSVQTDIRHLVTLQRKL